MPLAKCPFCKMGDLKENLNSDKYFCPWCFKIYSLDELKAKAWGGHTWELLKRKKSL